MVFDRIVHILIWFKKKSMHMYRMCILKRARVSVIFCGRWQLWAQIISQHYPPVSGPACNFLQCIDVTFTLEDNTGLQSTFKPFIAELWMYTLNSEIALYLHIVTCWSYYFDFLYVFINKTGILFSGIINPVCRLTGITLCTLSCTNMPPFCGWIRIIMFFIYKGQHCLLPAVNVVL